METDVDAIITGSPQLVADQLIVPVSSLEVLTAADPKNQCCTFQGSVVSLDTGNGEMQWRYRTISERPVLDPGTGVIGPSGVPVWGVPTIDRERGLVYINSGYTTFGRDPTWFAGPGNLFMAFGVTANK